MGQLIDNTGFYVEEFVPPEIVYNFGRSAVWFINIDVVRFCAWIKEYFNDAVVIINDWMWGGNLKYRGYRPPNCKIGVEYSTHRRCDGVDFSIFGITSDEIRQVIRDNFDLLNKKFRLTGIELETNTWVHADFRYTGLNTLREFRP
jgi:hypothetical protein